MLVPAFDYGALSVDLAERARDVAGRIRSRAQRQIEAIIETGRDLLSIKDDLGHGNFGPWLQAEFGMTERTARRYMSAAGEFGDKTDMVSDLPPSVVYELATSPEPVRETVVKRLEAGEKVGPVEVRDLVKQAKEAERKARETAKLKPSQRSYRKRKEVSIEREQEQARIRGERRMKATRDAAAMLREALGDKLDEFMELMEVAAGDFYTLSRFLREPSLEQEAA